MTAKVETNIVFECDSPDCVKRHYVTVPDAEFRTWSNTYDYADEYLPVGWALVKANPRGVTGRRRWIICSAACMGESLRHDTVGSYLGDTE